MQKLTLDQLVNEIDPGWPFVQDWISNASNDVVVLPATTENSSRVLVETQVTTRSPMGAVIYETGGLLVDSGWIRILGSGSSDLKRTLSGWNKQIFPNWPENMPFTLIADDIIGGFFALDAGEFNSPGSVYYLAPDTCEWESTELGYSEFLNFCFSNDLDDFYGPLRWSGWKEFIAELSHDQSIMTLPPLWSKPLTNKQNKDRERKPVPVEEMLLFTLEIQNKIRDLPDGAVIRLRTDSE